MNDDKLAMDEARRGVQHEAVKAEVERDVNAGIAAHAASGTADGSARVAKAAAEIHKHAVDEVVDTEREVLRSRGTARVAQVVDYIFGLIYALLAVRFVLGMIAARSSAGFVQFIRTISAPLFAPFHGIVASPEAPGGYTFEWSLLIAIVVYALIHLGIRGLLRMFATRRTEI